MEQLTCLISPACFSYRSTLRAVKCEEQNFNPLNFVWLSFVAQQTIDLAEEAFTHILTAK